MVEAWLNNNNKKIALSKYWFANKTKTPDLIQIHLGYSFKYIEYLKVNDYAS